MKILMRSILGLVTFALVSGSAQAAVLVDFNASNTTTVVTYDDSHDWVSDNTSGNGEIGSAYNEIGSLHSSIQTFSGAGLRIRNLTDGGQGTALFGFEVYPARFGPGADDDIFMRVSANAARTDDAGTGARAAVKTDGTWYVSEELLYTGNGTFDALSLDWFALAGDTSAGIVNISGTAVDAASFGTITMAGAWIEVLGQSDGSSPNSNYGVNILRMNLAPIPEPSSLALLGLAAVLLRMLRRNVVPVC